MPKNIDANKLLELHSRLLDGDRVASEEIISHLSAQVSRRIAQRFPRVDEQMIWDGTLDALFSYSENPSMFDEGKGIPLDSFLSMAAKRNVYNILRGEQRRRNREAKYVESNPAFFVELDPLAENIKQEDELELTNRAAGLLELLKDPADREVLKLRLRGVRETSSFAEVLGITDLTLEEQRKEVKKTKDRIDKVIRRHRGVKSESTY